MSLAQTGHSSADTFQVINWNIEYFGDPGHHNPATQTADVRSLMMAMDADVYALCEIVDRDSLAAIVRSLPGGYDFVISSFGSFAPDPGSPEYASAQKLALVYRRSRLRNPRPRALLGNSQPAYYNFSSGRFPFEVDVELLCRDSVWRPFSFIVLHAKAMTDGSSCSRRIAGCHELKDTLDRYFPSQAFLLLGDFNDDLDVSNCLSATESNYAYMIDDSNHYVALTLPLSRTGAASTAGYNSMIDHVVASDEMARNYVPGSAEILKNMVKALIPPYSNDVSDHYPVRTKYLLDWGPTSVPATTQISASLTVFPNPAHDQIGFSSALTGEGIVRIYELNGRLMMQQKIRAGETLSIRSLAPGSYLIRLAQAGVVTRHSLFSVLH
ncbi:MAG: T9SS type A sorting domain-containing protein [Bacteroidetes bacterium]|nr:T9SS type A sorting domain-containing protein [Bacteroidota bacterium]